MTQILTHTGHGRGFPAPVSLFFFRFSVSLFWFSDRPGQDLTHGVRRLPLGLGGHVGIGIQGKPGGVVSQHSRDRFDVHAVLERQGGEGVPLRYNYDKPEKPRISRVFGYQARFFILFQPEKSSREVVIS